MFKTGSPIDIKNTYYIKKKTLVVFKISFCNPINSNATKLYILLLLYSVLNFYTEITNSFEDTNI